MVADEFFDDDFSDDFGESDELDESLEESLDTNDMFEEESSDFEEEDDYGVFDNDEESNLEVAEPQSKDRSFFRSAIITMLVGAVLGGVSLWGFNKYLNMGDDHEISSMEPIKEPSLTDHDNPGFINVIDDMELLTLLYPEEKTKEPPPAPKIRKTTYFINVANCVDDECVRWNRLLLKKQKIRSIVVRFTEKTSVFEVISEKTFNDHHAAQWVKIINQTRQLSGQAYRKPEGKQFRLSLGLFPEKESARHALLSLNQLLKGQLSFILQTTQQKTLYQQVRTRSYTSKNQILALQRHLLELDEKFPMVWVEEYSYFL